MMTLAFLLVLALAFINLAVCILRMLVCIGVNSYKHDSGTAHRNRKYRSVGIHFIITIGLFVLAAKLACLGLGF